MPIKTLSTSAEELVPENRLRTSLAIQNEDATINMFIKFEKPGNTTVSSTDHDHRLAAGDVIGLNKLVDGKEQVQARVTIIAASGTPIVSFFETEEERR
ncbi:MAG: hypothetical protein ACE5HI_06670 [bacterium]